MPTIRIAFLDLSQVLTEILLETLAPIPEVEPVEPDSATDIDFLIARAGALTEDEVVAMLYERPQLRIVLVEERPPQSFKWELRPERQDLGNVGPEKITELVSAAAAEAA